MTIYEIPVVQPAEAEAGLTQREATALQGLASVSEETIACIEGLVDTAFWQFMLGDDFAQCSANIDLLCAAIRFRWGQVLAAVRHPEAGIRL